MNVITKIGKGRVVQVRATVENDSGGDVVSVTIDGRAMDIKRDAIVYIAPYFNAGDEVMFGGKAAKVLYPHGDQVMIEHDGVPEAVHFSKLTRANDDSR